MKKCYIITFDLKNLGINQQMLIDSIKETKIWARLTPNTYLVISVLSATELRNFLLRNLKKGDKIYVGQLRDVAAWYGYGDDIASWIRNNQK
ncbi:MAG: hypothetical protein RJA07_375 [Bacteroidota bacterium]|jgi:hypothetical protein